MALWHVPFDESGKHDSSSHIVFAGFLAQPKDWYALQNEWKAILEPYGILYFRGSDAFTFNKAWRQFGGNDPALEAKRDEIVLALADLGCKYATQGSACVMQVGDFNRQPQVFRERYGYDAFYCAFERGLSAMLRSRFTQPDDHFTIVYDDDFEDQDNDREITERYRRLIKKDPSLSQIVDGLCFLNDKKYQPLQFSDMWAYCLRRKAIGAPDGIWRAVLDKIDARFSDREERDVIA